MDLSKEWAPVRPKKRTFLAQHHKVLRDFLIKLDATVKHMKERNDGNYVFIFTDEWYINEKYGAKFTYQSADEREDDMDRKPRKG